MRSIPRTSAAVLSVLMLMAVLLFAGTIDLTNLIDYESQTVPDYITRDNTADNEIMNATTVLGRVLFYDKTLSSDSSISCASCHQQEFAFSDPAQVSQGVNGVTSRHSMRLVNARFSDESRFFWDRSAGTLEDQVTQPIRDHVQMGFSGINGDPDFDDLIAKMEATPYYKSLFVMAFGDATITEARMQIALAQFIRSIQSFDSKFDEGMALTNGDITAPFPNFTRKENKGKRLFLKPPRFEADGVRVSGGLGCAGCHEAPEFSVDIQIGLPRNNGVISVANDPDETDLTNSRSPSLRDLFSPIGLTNGPMMHDGSFATFDEVLDHYNDITFDPTVNPDLDPRLRGGADGPGQKLMLTQRERKAVEAFMKTLSGSDVYTNERWSDPFDADGTLTLIDDIDVVSIEINDGSRQRSHVDSLTITFGSEVTINPGAFSVVQRSTATMATFEEVSIITSEELDNLGRTVVTVQFDSHVRNSNNALEDGNYQLTLAGHLILRDGIPMGMDLEFGDDESDGFFSHYGDTDGDRDVDESDLFDFCHTLGCSVGDPRFNPNLDFDSDGTITIIDVWQIIIRYRTSLEFDF